MELGIGLFGDLTYNFEKENYQLASSRLKEIVEEAKLADKLGLDIFAIGEHHREDYAVATPEIMLAALATATKQIKLSSGVNVISSTDPVKLFKDFTTIDLLSGGRAELMAGRGSFIESFPVFGYNLSDYNELYVEKLDLLLKLRENKKLSWEGDFRAPIKDLTIYPQPERELPISIAVGGTPESVLRAAKLGLPIVFAIIGGNPKQFKPLIDFYKEQYIKHGHNPDKMKIGVHFHTYIANSKEEVMDEYFPYYARSMNRIGAERGWRSQFTPGSFEVGMSSEGALFMGSPDDVIEKMIPTLEILDVHQFIAHIDVGGPSHAQNMRTIELFGSKVMPTIKNHFS